MSGAAPQLGTDSSVPAQPSSMNNWHRGCTPPNAMQFNHFW
jgi:hypothetical protein